MARSGAEKIRTFAAALLLLVAGLSACGGGSGGTSTLHLILRQGAWDSANLSNTPPAAEGAACGSDILYGWTGLPGSQVKILSENNTTLGLATVPATGVITRRSTPGGQNGFLVFDCVFKVDVSLVGDANFLTLDIGGHYPGLSTSATAVNSNNHEWDVDLSPLQ